MLWLAQSQQAVGLIRHRVRARSDRFPSLVDGDSLHCGVLPVAYFLDPNARNSK